MKQMFIKWVIRNWIHVAQIREWWIYVSAEINLEFRKGGHCSGKPEG
jgi:hypothetical protein